jgi:tetratricopeptide (TPR) repeat protein
MTNELVPENTMTVNNDLNFSEMLMCTVAGTYPVMRYFLLGCGALTAISLALWLLFGDYGAMTVLASAIIVQAAALFAIWRAFSQQKQLMSNITTTISPQNVVSRVNFTSSESRFDWSRISAVHRVGNVIVIAIDTDPPSSICIPFRCFPSREDATRFFRLSHEYWRAGQARRHELGHCGSNQGSQQLWVLARIVLVVAILGVVISMLNTHGAWQQWVLLALMPAVIILLRKGDGGSGSALIANTALAKNDTKAALNASLQGLKKYPKNAMLRVTAGYSLYGLGQIEEGLKQCLAAVEARPGMALGYMGVGHGYREMADPDNALLYVCKGLELDPNLSWGFIMRANVHVDVCQYDEALKDCELAERLEGTYYAPFAARAGIHFSRVELDEAEQNCEKALKLCEEMKRSNRDKAIVNGLHGLILSRRGRSDEAFRAVDKAIELDPTFASHYSYAGSVRLRAHKLQEAWVFLEKAIEMKLCNRHLVSNYADMAIHQYVSKNAEEAHRYAELALEIDTQARSLAGKRAALIRDKKYDEALKEFGYEASA